MALKDIWTPLQDAVAGVPNSGSDVSAKPINDIADAVIVLEENKVDKVEGKGLSSNDYTDDDKAKLSNLPHGATIDAMREDITAIQMRIPSEASQNNQLADKEFVNSSIPTKTSQLTNDSGYLTENMYDNIIGLDAELLFKAENGNLKATLRYPNTIDNIAYGELTYRDIFIDNNLVPWGDMEQGFVSGLVKHLGNPEFSTDAYVSGCQSLKCFGSSNTLVMKVVTPVSGHTYYVACKTKVVRFSTCDEGRGAGFQYYTGSTLQVQTTDITDNFVTLSGMMNMQGSKGSFYLGTFGNADMDAYIDDTMLIDMSALFGDNIPTKEQMDILYEEYIKNYSIPKDKKYTFIDDENEACASICLNAFIERMAQKTTELGMTGSHFASPHGMVKTSYSTPQDLLKLGVAACSYPEANKIWGQRSITLNILGDNKRTLTINNAVISSVSNDITPYYDFLGGKGGSLVYDEYHRAQVLVLDIENQPVVIALAGLGRTSYTNIFKSAKEIADMIKAKLNNETMTEGTNIQELIASGGGYAACILPSNSSLYCYNYAPEKLITRINSVSNTPTASRYPASTSKIMTMICALDYVKNPLEIITIEESDITGGSGSTYYAGDKIRFIDAITVMMLESSNTLANAIARFVGNKIVQSITI